MGNRIKWQITIHVSVVEIYVMGITNPLYPDHGIANSAEQITLWGLQIPIIWATGL
jgi:hypothetical protein